jgi:hypothetical protein
MLLKMPRAVLETVLTLYPVGFGNMGEEVVGMGTTLRCCRTGCATGLAASVAYSLLVPANSRVSNASFMRRQVASDSLFASVVGNTDFCAALSLASFPASPRVNRDDNVVAGAKHVSLRKLCIVSRGKEGCGEGCGEGDASALALISL